MGRDGSAAEWVRQSLREARSGVSTAPVEQRLLVVREASAFAYPTADLEQMNEEIECGYLRERS